LQKIEHAGKIPTLTKAQVKEREAHLKLKTWSTMSQSPGAGIRTVNLSESPKATETIKNNNYPQKRIKIDERDDSKYIFQKSPKTKTDF
jgi:hypothetical protein